jgi:hypothetical protein
MSALLPGSGLRLNPDAAHPPFSWQVALPEDWALLDVHPATWQRGLDRLIDERFNGRHLRRAQVRSVREHLEELVVAAQRAGVLLSLVGLGALSTGEPASAGLNLAWYDSAPLGASLALARQAIGRQGIVEEVETDAGMLLLQRDHTLVSLPGATARAGLTSLQAFLPLTGSTWTAVVATSSAHPEMTDLLRDLVLITAGSIQPLDDDPGVEPQSADAKTTAEFTPVEKPDRPGIERGFGTMVLRRFPPNESS